VDDRGDHPRQQCRGRSVDGLVTGEHADDALLEASGKDEAFTPVGLGTVPEDQLVQVRAAPARTPRPDG
jgi:hypothetical protein